MLLVLCYWYAIGFIVGTMIYADHDSDIGIETVMQGLNM